MKATRLRRRGSKLDSTGRLRTLTMPRMMASGLVLGLATFSVAVIPAQSAYAATQTVTNCNDSGTGSLRQAVLTAASGDDITFALSPACSTITLTTGVISIASSLTISGPGASQLAVSGNGAGSVFSVAKSITVAISGLTIEDATARTAGKGTTAGGGINNLGTLTVTDSTITHNSADVGSGIDNGGTLTVSGSSLSDNGSAKRGHGSGGALYNSGTASITDSALSANHAGNGGGINNLGTLTVTGSTLSDNDADHGGGIEASGSITITDSTLSGNTAEDGGGLDNAGGANVAVTGSTLSGNSVTSIGGAINNGFGGTITVSNTTMSGNQAQGGGAVANTGAPPDEPAVVTIANSTLTGNTVTTGDASAISSSKGTVDLKATIVAAEGTASDCDTDTPITDQGYNIDDDTSCAFTAGTSISDSTTLDGTLGPLANNGGPTETVALLTGSPAIDQVPAPDCPATDQRGAPRTVPCDIGAYDTDGTLVVTNCNDSGAGSLRDAVAGAAPDEDISFALSPACSTIVLTTGVIDISIADLTISGPGQGALAVSGDNASQVFETSSDDVAIFGITIEDGANSTGGGGIENDGGGLTISDTSILDNTSCPGGGGGIWNNGGDLTVTNSTLSDNGTCGSGGAIRNDGGVLHLDTSTVSDNGADAGGGGIENTGTVIVTSSTFSANTASNGGADGGAIENASSGILKVTNSTVVGNGASGTGGGIANSGATTQLTATIVGQSQSTGGACAGIITDKGSNIDDDGTCGFSGTSINHSTSLDGKLGTLSPNGGPTDTVALVAGSPAIDVVPSGDCPVTDQRGAPRAAPCDIGAFDTDGDPTITKVKPPKGAVGKKVTISGTNFSDVTEVTFNGTPAAITAKTGTKITTKVPVGATTGLVRVITVIGVTATGPKSFKVT